MHRPNPFKTAALKAQQEKRIVFMPFLTAGDPDFATSLKLAQSLVQSGADALEIGFPFTDPIADGPTIQAACSRSLEHGFNPNQGFAFIQTLRKITQIPIGLLVYYNTVLAYGLEKFYRQAARSGVNGVLIADLPVEEAAAALKTARKHHIFQVFIISRTAARARISKILKFAQGYIYLVSVAGTTGARDSLAQDLLNFLPQLKTLTALPVFVGFGISKPEQVQALAQAGADGVIVGSALIKQIARNLEQPKIMLDEFTQLAKDLKAGTRL
jgi:tryptophan synthase alpha chain